MPDLWEACTVLAKFALYLGLLGASGTVFCGVIFRLQPMVWRIVKYTSLGTVGVLLSFMLKGVALTGDASGLTDPEMLGLLWETQSGTALLWQLAGLGLMFAGLLFDKIGHWISALGGIIALGSFATSGHILDLESTVLLAVLTIHMIGIAIWIGILTPLQTMAADPSQIEQTAILGEKFGNLARYFVPLLILAGIVMTYTLVGSVSAIIITAYGQTLLAKIGLVACLLALAAANKLKFVPDMKKGDPTAASALVHSIKFEKLAVFAILLVTAVLTTSLSLPT